jgi:hypothetical protein
MVGGQHRVDGRSQQDPVHAPDHEHDHLEGLPSVAGRA